MKTVVTKAVFFFAALFLANAPAMAQNAEKEAPFGLKWGMSEEQLESEGITLTEATREEGVVSYTTSELPRNLSEIDFYQVFFSEKRGLQKITVLGETIKNDARGSKGKETFDYYVDIVSDRYGQPTQEIDYIGIKLYKDPDEFYQCLAYDGCGLWATLWEERKGVNSMVQVKGISRGEGFVTIHIEGPKWKTVLKDVEDKKRQSDRDAF